MNSTYHIVSGRRIVANEKSVGPEAALDYLRSIGCKRDEAIYYGLNGAMWRGAIYRARAVDLESQGRPGRKRPGLPYV